MATEVERKFLVIGDDWKRQVARSFTDPSGLSVIHRGNGDPDPHCRRGGGVSHDQKRGAGHRAIGIRIFRSAGGRARADEPADRARDRKAAPYYPGWPSAMGNRCVRRRPCRPGDRRNRIAAARRRPSSGRPGWARRSPAMRATIMSISPARTARRRSRIRPQGITPSRRDSPRRARTGRARGSARHRPCARRARVPGAILMQQERRRLRATSVAVADRRRRSSVT